MRKIHMGRILKNESKEQHLSTVPKSCSFLFLFLLQKCTFGPYILSRNFFFFFFGGKNALYGPNQELTQNIRTKSALSPPFFVILSCRICVPFN